LDSVTTTSFSIRWNKLSDANTYTVCAIGQQGSIITSDTVLTFRNLQPATMYIVIIGVGSSTCSVGFSTQQTCYNHIYVTTLTPTLQNFTYDSRFVPFNRNDSTRVPQFVDSTIFYRGNGSNIPGSIEQLETLLLTLQRLQIPMDSVVIKEGYGGSVTPCLNAATPSGDYATVILKMTRPLSESEKNSLRSMSIIPTSRILFGEFPVNSQVRGQISYSSQIQQRLYVLPRATSTRTTQQELGLALHMSPQPLSGAGLLTLTAQRPLTADIRVVNMLGQTVATLAQGRLFSTGETVLPCSVSALSGGVYAVQIVEQGRVLLTQAVIVAR
jgi:hypothetical protein